MTDNGAGLLTDPHCVPWNKGKLIGPSLRCHQKRRRLQLDGFSCEF
jgi:hypothetical protein